MAENGHPWDNLNMSDDSRDSANHLGNGINWNDAVNLTVNFSSGKEPQAEATHGFFDRYIDQIPLLFYPGSLFYLLHGLALMSLSASVIVSFTLIVYQCSSNRRKARTTHVSDTTTMHTNVATISGVVQFAHQARQADFSFMKWNISERLVMYLAVADLCTGISHMLDHIYIVQVQSNPPDLVCSVFAFILHGSFIAPVDRRHVHGRERVQSDRVQQETPSWTDGLEVGRHRRPSPSHNWSGWPASWTTRTERGMVSILFYFYFISMSVAYNYITYYYTEFPYIRTDSVELTPWFAQAFCYKPRTFPKRTENIPV